MSDPAGARPREGDEDQQPAEPALVPPVVASYAAYLRTRTHAEPEITVRGDDAEVSVTAGDKTLTLAFRFTKEWALRTAALRQGRHTTRFGRGELAEAVGALLQP